MNKPLVNKFLGKRLLAHNEKAISNLAETAEEEKVEKVGKVGKVEKKKPLALCLGAGIGADVGMPLWAGLISDLMVNTGVSNGEYFDNGEFVSDKVLQNANLFTSINALEAAEYVNIYLDKLKWKYPNTNSEPDQFLKLIVKDILQRRFDNCPKCVRDWSLLDELSKLILHPKGVKHIMTYNFDDILESRLLSAGALDKQNYTVGGKHGVMFHSKDISDCVFECGRDDERFIYHIHGKVHINTKPGKPDPYATPKHKSEDDLIFAERSYYDLESDGSYNRTNTCHAHFLNAFSCLFIGCSAQDYNFRRIVKGMSNKKESDKQRQHFIAFEINSLIKSIYHKSPLSFVGKDPKQAKTEFSLLQAVLELQKGYYKKHSITPIYFIYDEQPVQCKQSKNGCFCNIAQDASNCRYLKRLEEEGDGLGKKRNLPRKRKELRNLIAYIIETGCKTKLQPSGALK